MASKTTAYANSAIRVFWLNDGNRTHTQSATNFCPTIRLRSTYKRCVLESNQCKRFCRPSPSHSDNSPYCSFSRTRTYTLTFVVLCDNPFHYETICTQWRNWTLSFGFGDQLAAIAYHAFCRNNKIRTCDIWRIRLALYQLSYIPICWECRIRTYDL